MRLCAGLLHRRAGHRQAGDRGAWRAAIQCHTAAVGHGGLLGPAAGPGRAVPAAPPAPDLSDGPESRMSQITRKMSRAPRRSAALPSPRLTAVAGGVGERLPMAPRLRVMPSPSAQPEPEPWLKPPVKGRSFGLSSFAWRLDRPTISANDEPEPPVRTARPSVEFDDEGGMPAESRRRSRSSSRNSQEGEVAQ